MLSINMALTALENMRDLKHRRNRHLMKKHGNGDQMGRFDWFQADDAPAASQIARSNPPPRSDSIIYYLYCKPGKILAEAEEKDINHFQDRLMADTSIAYYGVDWEVILFFILHSRLMEKDSKCFQGA